jgi:methylphosphotriester-DNA--protein-cysteine methyltransferase
LKEEYEKLYRALKTSYESEKRLVKRCKELNDTIVSNATRVKAALRLTQEDSNTISLLKKEVDRAWKLVETAKEKEERGRKIIMDLRAEIAHLTKVVESGTGLSVSAENNVSKMLEEKEALKKALTDKTEKCS